MYNETQRFNQKWLWALVLAIAAMSLYGVFQQLVLGIPFGTNPASDPWMIVIAVIFGIGMPMFFYYLKLEIKVTDALYVRFFPLMLKFKKTEFDTCKAITYRPILDYGGWGMRWGRKGRAYNISGNKGVMLKHKGKNILIGSQRSDELVEALKSL